MDLDDKRRKAEPEIKSWFDLYIELKSELEQRIFALEERVKKLEQKPREGFRIG